MEFALRYKKSSNTSRFITVVVALSHLTFSNRSLHWKIIFCRVCIQVCLIGLTRRRIMILLTICLFLRKDAKSRRKHHYHRVLYLYCQWVLTVPQFAERARRSNQTFQAGDTGQGRNLEIHRERIEGVAGFCCPSILGGKRMGVSMKGGTPMDCLWRKILYHLPLKWMIFGVPLFQETPRCHVKCVQRYWQSET